MDDLRSPSCLCWQGCAISVPNCNGPRSIGSKRALCGFQTTRRGEEQRKVREREREREREKIFGTDVCATSCAHALGEIAWAWRYRSDTISLDDPVPDGQSSSPWDIVVKDPARRAFASNGESSSALTASELPRRQRIKRPDSWVYCIALGKIRDIFLPRKKNTNNKNPWGFNDRRRK